jgi:hypothetical protein
MLKGSCGCGRVHYVVAGPLLEPVNHCHCWRCRKHSGASFGTSASIRAADFSVVAGADLLSFWESSPRVRRVFARCCGSPICKEEDADPTMLRLRLGTLDTDPGCKVALHFMPGSKAPWVDIDDGLAREGDGPPFGQRDMPQGS